MRPTPRMPRANSRNAKLPASGRSAPAACAAVSMLLTPGDVQRHGGRQNDEPGSEIGVEHAAPGVPANAPQLLRRPRRIAHQRTGVGGVHVFDLLRGLPEEQVGTDGGAENADHDGGGGGIRCESRPDHAQRDLSPRHVNGEEHRRVREQRQRQPLQERHIAMVGHEDLQQQRQHHEECGHEVAIEARHQLGTSPMAATSAAMLSILAISSSPTTLCRTTGGNASLMLAASPLPVVRPMSAHMN